MSVTRLVSSYLMSLAAVQPEQTVVKEKPAEPPANESEFRQRLKDFQACVDGKHEVSFQPSQLVNEGKQKVLSFDGHLLQVKADGQSIQVLEYVEDPECPSKGVSILKGIDKEIEKEGQILWQFHLPYRVESFFSDSKGSSYFYGYDAALGNILGQIQNKNLEVRAFIPHPYGKEPLRLVPTNPIATTPDGGLFAVVAEPKFYGYLAKLDKDFGIQWMNPFTDRVFLDRHLYNGPILDPKGNAYFPVGGMDAGHEHPLVWKFSAEGKPEWNYMHYGYLETPVLTADGGLVIPYSIFDRHTARIGIVTKITAEGKGVCDNWDGDNAGNGIPKITLTPQGKYLVVYGEGGLRTYDDGAVRKPVWEYKIGDSVSQPAVISNSNIFVLGDKTGVYQLDLDGKLFARFNPFEEKVPEGAPKDEWHRKAIWYPSFDVNEKGEVFVTTFARTLYVSEPLEPREGIREVKQVQAR